MSAAHREAALGLLIARKPLRPREGSFLGQLAYDLNEPTPKQEAWLVQLLDRHGQPPLPGGDV